MFNFQIVQVPIFKKYEGASQRMENQEVQQKWDFISLQRVPQACLGGGVGAAGGRGVESGGRRNLYL